MTEHRVHTSATEAGWSAACTCGWRTVRRTRQLRDQDTDAHHMANALATAEEVSECEL
jgi:hypothetical protein